ncbi:MAG: S9 family peptidase [Thiotrichales bacterium]|nr:S9 family peptidase [Thiotrichales bacterium]
MNTLPFGTWPSPITSDAIVAETVRLASVSLSGGRIGWLEGRPGEGGRNVLVRTDAAGRSEDITPSPFNVRSRVHEYGGGAYAVSGDRVWFSNFEDGRVYVQTGTARPVPLTAEGTARFADLTLDPGRRRLLAVRETHAGDGLPVDDPSNAPIDDRSNAATNPPTNDPSSDSGNDPGDDPGNDPSDDPNNDPGNSPSNSPNNDSCNILVAISIDDGSVRVLASGHDFYAAPTPSPDGKQLAWLTWDQPDMPWDAAVLWLAELDGDGVPGEPVRIAGGSGCSAFQPAWAPDGALWCVTDPEGWWNLHRWHDGELRCMHRARSEFGKPLWQLGTTTFGFDGNGCVVCTWRSDGAWRLGRLESNGTLAEIPSPWTSIDSLIVEGPTAAFIGGAPDRSAAVVSLDLDSGQSHVHRTSSALSIDDNMLSRPEALTFPTGGGTEVAHGYYYPPRNASCRGPAGESPPLIVMSHGGPTGATSDTLNPATQFWTSRGFAVLDVDYRGSTGYGRAYRERLYREWGVADVEDCVAGALHLADTGRADRARLAIRGGSAGGYTTLAALTFHDVFRAGASYYGISDLEVLAADTHKFEARYLDRLVGAWPAERDVYRARSPLHHASRLGCPIIFFQGLDDRVVPPNQAERMVDALDRQGLPVACLLFEGEGHGFRQAGTVRRCLEAELLFYARVFGFEPADALAPVEIRNL